MSQTLDRPLDLKSYFRMFWRRRGLVVLCSVVLICTSLVALEFIPPGYESTATISVEERQRLSDELEKLMGGMGRPVTTFRMHEQRLGEIVNRVQSRPFLERVVRLLRMNEDPAILEQAQQMLERRPASPVETVEEMATRIVVARLRRKISIAPAALGFYRIKVTDSDPRNAQLLARWISELFVDIAAQSSLEDLRRAHEFGTEQLRIYEDQLQRSEAELEKYKESRIEESLGQRIVTGDNITVAETLRRRVQDEAELARIRIAPFQRELENAGLEFAGETVLADPEIQSEARSLAVSLEEALTSRLVGERAIVGDWPPAGRYVAERRALFQLIERRVRSIEASVPEKLQDTLSRFVFSTLDQGAHVAAAGFLDDRISRFRRTAQSGPRGELELRRLEAEVSNNREMLNLFRAQLIAGDVTQAVETTNLGPRIEILDPAQLPLSPAAPNRMMILMAALGMGPLLGLGLALAVEITDSTMYSLGDFERSFSGPVLGTIPLVSRITQQIHPVRRYWIQISIAGVILATLLFFVAQATFLPEFGAGGDSVQLVDPGEAVRP